MKVIGIKQGSRDWLDWRGKGLGASDAPAIMGISPWSTPFQLWLEKTGLGERMPSNEFAVAAMRRGNDLEPVARKLVEAELGLFFPALAATHDVHEFIRASFDGYHEETNTLLEIKCPSKVDHAEALKGRVPKKYFPQLQHQFLVSGAKTCIYASYDGKESLALVTVYPDSIYIGRLTQALVSFWGNVNRMEAPVATDKDVKAIVDNVNKSLEILQKAIKNLTVLAGASQAKTALVTSESTTDSDGTVWERKQ